MRDVPLPEPFCTQHEGGPVTGFTVSYYTADQCKAYGDARVRAALEVAAMHVEGLAFIGSFEEVADAIRKLMP